MIGVGIEIDHWSGDGNENKPQCETGIEGVDVGSQKRRILLSFSFSDPVLSYN